MPKIVWVLVPLLAYAGYLLVAALRRRVPARYALNVHSSLLLMLYVLTTAGLGVFWVANQQLPVFDWHYLFGYATILLLAVHLSFNLPVAWRFLRKRGKSDTSTGSPSTTRRAVGLWLGIGAALGGAFFLGMRHGRSQLSLGWDGDGAGPGAGPLEAIEQYHAYSSHSRAGVFARAPSVSWGALPQPFKDYPAAESIELPPPQESPSRPLGEALRSPAPRRGALDRAALSNILFHTAGVTLERGGFALRAAPSSGALFPTEIYAVLREVADVPPGVYHYDPRAHRLVKLSQEVSDSALGAAAGTLPGPAAFALTSVFRRTGHKYRDRAYRYAIADAGHLLENLRIAGHEAGFDAVPLQRFDEARAAEALGVDAIEEGVIALVALDGVRAAASGGRAPFDQVAPPEEPTALGVTGMVHAATSLRLIDPPKSDERLALPAASPAERPALATIAERRSQRRFLEQPIALADLSGLLAGAAQPPLLSDAVVVHLVANRVEGLEPGVYRYHPREGALSLTRAGDFSGQAQGAALAQDVIGDAAVVFVLAADRRKMLDARGYRHVFLEAGMVGERLLLGAVARGLGACPVGAFYDDEAAALVGVDPGEQWVLHFAGVGRVAE